MARPRLQGILRSARRRYVRISFAELIALYYYSLAGRALGRSRLRWQSQHAPAATANNRVIRIHRPPVIAAISIRTAGRDGDLNRSNVISNAARPRDDYLGGMICRRRAWEIILYYIHYALSSFPSNPLVVSAAKLNRSLSVSGA